jgi:uncharacterized protein (TIGR02302 family)
VAETSGTSEKTVSADTSAAPSAHGNLPKNLKRRVAIAGIALWWERVWPVLWPPTGVAGVYALLALTGLFEALPVLLQWVALVATLGTCLYLIWPHRHLFAKPTWTHALRRLESMNRLPHRPLSTYADQPAQGTGSDKLWAAHKQWLKAQLRALRVRFPSPGLAAKDPYALRAALLLALVSSYVVAGPASAPRLANALFPGFSSTGTSGHLDAWITPPDYTGRAPIFLTQDQRDIEDVPQGSLLNVQIFGGSTPHINLGAEALIANVRNEGTQSAFETTNAIESDSILSITQGARELGNWAITTTPDLPPTVQLLQQVEASRQQTLKFLYQVTDDYGVISLRADLALDPFFVQADKDIFSLNDEPLPRAGFNTRTDELVAEQIETQFELPLPGLRVTDASHTAYKDLTAHPWAGLPVSLTLVATDDAEQEGESRTVTLALPARPFQKPLAAAIVEQRQRLALSPTSRGSVAGFLNAFTMDADRTLEDKSVYLGLRAVYWRLTRARHPGDLEGVSELLWDIALHIEDGDLSLAERDLRAAREALAQALAEGASADEIEQLMQDLKTALTRYLDDLSDRQPAQADQSAPQPENGQTMERSDLEDMLDAIGDLARTGARDQAQELLSQLDDILENIETPEGPNELSEGEKSLSDAINEMGEMIDRQRSLMDETFQHGQGAQAGSGEGDDAPRTQGGQGSGESQQSAPPLESLRNQQEALRQQLQEMIGKLGESGQAVPGGLDRAAEAMEKAEDRLSKGRSDAATGAQAQALDQLREGTQALADAMFDAISQNADPSGQRSSGAQTDPLGRPTGNGQNSSQSTELPDEMELQRARQILELLRKRAAELGRPQGELDYLERLLRRF